MTTPAHKKVSEIFDVIDEAHEARVLSDWDYGFIEDQMTRTEQYGTATRFSKKQEAHLDRIYEAVCNWGEPVRRRK